jgi:hypothetical protein
MRLLRDAPAVRCACCVMRQLCNAPAVEHNMRPDSPVTELADRELRQSV